MLANLPAPEDSRASSLLPLLEEYGVTVNVEPPASETGWGRVLMGTERSLVIQAEERHRLAVHESGHTAVAYFLPKVDPLYDGVFAARWARLGLLNHVHNARVCHGAGRDVSAFS